MMINHPGIDDHVTALEQDTGKTFSGSQHRVRAGRVQRFYRGHRIDDAILITPTRCGLDVETDIIIPFAVDPLKGTAGARDMMVRNKRVLTTATGSRLPDCVRGPWFHQHYAPNLLPDVASLHVHIAGTAKTLSQAERLAEGLWDIVDPDGLAKLLQ